MKKQSTSIQWNQVTPLSKVLAAILFVALPFIAFIWGMKYQEMIDSPVMEDINQLEVSTPMSLVKHATTAPVRTPVRPAPVVRK